MEENESIDIADSEFASPRLKVNHADNDNLSDEEDGGLDELIIMDEAEQQEREDKLAGCEDAEMLKE